MRLAYSCHDSFHSHDTNTQQNVWTLLEVARLDVEVELFVPSVEGAASGAARAAIGAYYGAAPQQMPAAFTIVPFGRRAARALAQGWFDWRIASRLARGRHDLVWTRDPLAVLSCVRAGRDVVFETYRPDSATRRGSASGDAHV